MQASAIEKPVTTPKQEDARSSNDPLAGRELQCPYCGCEYTLGEGCFCVRVTRWDGSPMGK